jgi:hypothetical protein
LKIRPVILARSRACPAINKVVEADAVLLATHRNKLHFLFIARLESNPGRGRNIQAQAERPATIEFKISIDFEEMKVRAHLDRPVTGITYFHGDGRPSSVNFDLSFRQDQSSNRCALF